MSGGFIFSGGIMLCILAMNVVTTYSMIIQLGTSKFFEVACRHILVTLSHPLQMFCPVDVAVEFDVLVQLQC
jgi:hypothetical protein